MLKKICIILSLLAVVCIFAAFGCNAGEGDAKNYGVTFDANGGVIAETSLTSYTLSDTYIDLPTAIRTGYDFLGWKVGDSAPVTKIAAGTTGDLAFIAVWQIKTYSITFNAKGGVVADNSLTSYTISEDDIDLPTATRDGYDFLGWKVGDSAPVTKIAAGTTGDLVLAAAWQWNGVLFSISYDTNGGDITDNDLTEYPLSDVDIDLPTAIRAGYDFLGWKIGDSDPITVIAAGTTGDLVLTAAWQIKHYGIIYNLKGGEIPETAIETYTLSDEDTGLPIATRAEYEFLGWKIGENAPTMKIAAGTIGDLVLTAAWQWTGTYFNITFDNSSASELTNWADGTTGVKTVQINLDEILDAPLIRNDVASSSEKANSDYRFLYWYYLDDAGVKHEVSFGKAFNKDNFPTNERDITFYTSVMKQWAGPY